MKTIPKWNSRKDYMNIQELEYILCIAKHQNLTKAAQELYISQPTLSKHLKKLEQEMNGKLFSRSGNRYIPTHLGRQYMEYAKKVLNLHANWQKELEDLTSYKTGELNIAFPPLRSSCIIPKVMPAFHEKYPNVKINFLEESNEIEEKLLQNETIDFAVFNETVPNPNLSYEIIGKEEILMMLPNKQFDTEYIDLNEVKEEPFVLNFQNQTTGKIVAAEFENHNIKPNVLFHTRNTQASALLCQQGYGICFIPRNYVDIIHFDTPPHLYSVGKEGIYSTLVVAYRKNKYMTEYEKEFIRLIRENLHIKKEKK